jgi:CRISPR system Cascade subunit CasE
MYLSRLILNMHSRQVCRELADLYEMHRTVMKAFAGRLTDLERVLFRVDIHPTTGITSLLVQSQEKPDWAFLLESEKDYLLKADDLPMDVENVAVKEINLSLAVGQTLAFRLKANPTKRLGKDAGEKHHQRVGLLREDEQIKWLQRKIEAAGASLISTTIGNENHMSGKLFRENEKHKLKFVSVQFDGVLQVREPDLFVKTIATGFGSGKGFGFGLISLAAARQ